MEKQNKTSIRLTQLKFDIINYMAFSMAKLYIPGRLAPSYYYPYFFLIKSKSLEFDRQLLISLIHIKFRVLNS